MNREEELRKQLDDALDLIHNQQLDLIKLTAENTKLKLMIKTIGEIINYD